MATDTGLGRRPAMAFLNELFDAISHRGRNILGKKPAPILSNDRSLESFGQDLLSRRGEASGVTLARSLLAKFEGASELERLTFLLGLAEGFGPDPSLVERALISHAKDPTQFSLDALHSATEPRRQELIRRLNLAPGGTAALVRMRESVLSLLPRYPALQAIDTAFVHLFSSWFNRGFLVLKPIDWNTSATILEKIIKYEAVHAIQDWEDLRNRLEPQDRRCYAFFHPQLADEPLIFVEVALTREMPATIGPLLDKSRLPIDASSATTAVFYSISNCQRGLSGISFGNFLIKQVVENLARDLPNLSTFVTLSPVPGLTAWCRQEQTQMMDEATSQAIAALEAGEENEVIASALTSLAARYLLRAKTPSGKPTDPVARFHLGNGARLERINFLGDPSPRGMRQSFGLMVNYLYLPQQIETHHEAFAESGKVIASENVRMIVDPAELPLRFVPSAPV